MIDAAVPDHTPRDRRNPSAATSRAATTSLRVRQEHRVLVVLLLVFVGLAVGIMTVGIWSYRAYAAQYRAQVESQLSIIAELKGAEIGRWRFERMGDAAVVYENAAFSDLVARFLGDANDIDAKRQILAWMAQYRTHLQYDQTRLMDPQGVTHLSNPATLPPASAFVRDRVTYAVRSRQVEMTTVYRSDADGRPHITTLIPILDTHDRQRTLGILALRVDPEEYLFPYIHRWPTASQTAETELVGRDGGDALFLSDLRFQNHSALSLRIPLARTEVLAVKAALGQTGIVEGINYRGSAAIGDIRRVPGAPWFLVAQIDSAEVFAPLRARAWDLVTIVGALLFAAGAGVGMVWRQQRARVYRERYEAAEALSETADRLRRAEQMGHLGCWTLDLNTRRLSWSDEVFRMHGVPVVEDDVAWDTLTSWVHPDDRASHARAMAAIQQEGSGALEYRVVRPDRTVRHIAAYGELARDAAGAPASIFGTVLDVTELRQKERELQERNDELARFTYTVSHDLKSPLVTITTFLGFLEQDVASHETARTAQDLAYIRGAADRMARLLDELLDLARVGRKVNPSVETPLQVLVQDARALVAGRLASRDVQVRVTSEPVLLYGDRARLVEVFQNLLDNAVKFMGDQPSPCVEIGARADGDDTIAFVRDNGIGIDPRHQHRLFGLFERLDPGAEGTGMGLALVRRIVEVHGGRVWVESDGVGKGATFCLRLPQSRRPPAKEQTS